MDDIDKQEAPGWDVFISLFVEVARFLFVLPYWAPVRAAAYTLSGRNRLAALAYATHLERDGLPVPDPLPPVDEMRRRHLDHIPNPDGLIRGQDVLAAEAWLVMGARVASAGSVAAAGVVLAGAGAVAWQYGLPWAEARVAAAPWSGVPLVAAAAAGVWVAAGWLASTALFLTVSWGPVRWVTDWCAGRASQELWGSSPPGEQ